ncbi:MAG: hypothetical protein L6R28_16095 [Planctomycetes bacterium]|nr:hypothetical protein [Planctomycetota bacterium]
MGKQRPLTSQFNFFLMPEETNRFLKEFSVDGISVFEDRSETNTPKAVEDIEKSWHMKFCPSELVPNIIMHRAGELFFIDRSVSPVIEYSGCTLSQDKLYRGRIRVETGYDGRDGWVSYPDSLFELYDSMRKFLRRRFLTRDKQLLGGYLSKGTVKHVEAGGKISQF